VFEHSGAEDDVETFVRKRKTHGIGLNEGDARQGGALLPLLGSEPSYVYTEGLKSAIGQVFNARTAAAAAI
jgi:hypothetical protein